MFFIGFPLLLLPVAVYHIFALIFSAQQWTAQVAAIPMVSGGEWIISFGDILVFAGLLCLYGEIFKATRTSDRSIIDHLLSMALFVVMLLEFILWKPFSTSTFALLIVIEIIDVIGGFTITIRGAKRDYSVERSEPVA